MNSEQKRELEIYAAQIRRGIIEGTYNAKAGHPGGSLSAADVRVMLRLRFTALSRIRDFSR